MPSRSWLQTAAKRSLPRPATCCAQRIALGLFGALALVTNTAILLVIIGGLFVLETLSVIAQVISFRGFGRRIFRMSPIHHHFELAGWPEFTVIVRFWIVAGLCSAVGIGLFYADFIARGGLG